MNIEEIIKELRKEFPNGVIVKNVNSQKQVTEIVCELENSKETSRAIAVIDSSTLHYHKKITEKYKVLKGELTVIKYDKNAFEYKEYILKVDDEITLLPGEIHSSLGEATWVEVISTPAWTKEDYIELETLFKKYVK